MAGQVFNRGVHEHPVRQCMQVGLEFTEPRSGIAVGGDGTNFDAGVAGEQAQDFAPGIAAGT
ncbi:hypothetical protein GCM10009688_31030 [Arthrobacter gandavensis]|uniref:Uncharacterized protein n=1 Tax=Arthrobacter gandavensis TaxID=169960 RepID=A0ABN2PJW1_9MICC